MRYPTAKTVSPSWLDFTPAAALLIVSTGVIFVATFSPSGDRGQYAVVAPPWYNQTDTIGLIGRAGGDIVDFGGIANVIIAHSDSPGFIRTLYRDGAWLVIDPAAMRGCLGFARDAQRTPRNV